MTSYVVTSRSVDEDPRWALAPCLILTTWRDEEEAIAYLSDSGDMHWLSGAARLVIESLVDGNHLTDQQIHHTVTQSMRCGKDDVAEYYIPYLCSLGLICQVNP